MTPDPRLPPVQFGVDLLRDEDFARLEGLRVGLLTNTSAVDEQLTSTRRLLWESSAVHLAALFSPEHGWMGLAAEGEKVGSAHDPRTGLPIHSLYGDTLRPTAEMLAGLDVVVVDLQDVGARFYTFIWTVTHMLEACGEHGVEVLILDRPNPLGGAVSGPPLDPALASFVGRSNIPIMHGMTLGELAAMFNAVWNATPCRLEVIACEGWQREQRWPELGRPWVPPSPAMPHFETVMHYPGACLIEGTNLSEGRGTALPFQIVGAPFIDAELLAEQLNALDEGTVRFRPHYFRPTAGKWQGEICAGVQVHITAPDKWQPIHTWLDVLMAIHALYPDLFAWQPAHFDRLIGSVTVRQRIEAGDDLADITAGWPAACNAFAQRRARYLLYA